MPQKPKTRTILCPICSSELTDSPGDLFTCPKGHGTLVTGRYLSDIETSAQFHEHADEPTLDTKHQITCPRCSKEMHKVDYNHTKIMIDSYANCHYRWLDAGEITKIRNFKPNISTKDLFTVLDLDMKIHQAQKREHESANPRLPLQGSYRGGAEIATGVSGDHRVRMGAIAGQGLYGIIKGLIHSKTTRILTITTILLLGLTVLLIPWSYRDTLRSLY